MALALQCNVNSTYLPLPNHLSFASCMKHGSPLLRKASQTRSWPSGLVLSAVHTSLTMSAYPISWREPAPILDMSQNTVSYSPASARLVWSGTARLPKVPASGPLARLWALPIEEAEAKLSRRYRKNDPNCSLLSFLQTPGNGITRVQAAALVLQELADGSEDASAITSLVVRYVHAHRIWTDHPDPAVDSLEAFLGTIGGIRYVRAGAANDECPQSTRARYVRQIEKHWGSDWFEKIPAGMKDSTWSRASDCSHQLLRLIAAAAKNGVQLEAAKHAWARSIRRRRDESVRKELRMRCSRSPFITTDDVRSLDLTPDVDQRDHRSSGKVCSDEPIGDQLNVDPGVLGTKRRASPSRLIYVDDTAQRKRRRQFRQDFYVDSRTCTPAGDDNGSLVSDRVGFDQRTDDDRGISLPSPVHGESSARTALLSGDTRPVAHVAADDLLLSHVRSSSTLLCYGPSIAVKLRRVIESLVSQDKSSMSIRLAGRCCTGCRSKIDVLDEMIDGVIRVASLVEELTDHGSDGFEPKNLRDTGLIQSASQCLK